MRLSKIRCKALVVDWSTPWQCCWRARNAWMSAFWPSRFLDMGSSLIRNRAAVQESHRDSEMSFAADSIS